MQNRITTDDLRAAHARFELARDLRAIDALLSPTWAEPTPSAEAEREYRDALADLEAAGLLVKGGR